MSVYLQGFGVTLGLLIAIGAQNAFVLSRAVRGEHVALVAGLCIALDAILITLGVSGVGAILATSPGVTKVAVAGSIVFLMVYGGRAGWSALHNRSMDLSGVRRVASRRATIIATVAVTLLNPHMFLDTFVLLAGISAPLSDHGRLVFGAGAITASTLWFCCLASAGRALAPWFRRPTTWKLLDAFVCVTMWILAAVIAVKML